jgi:hypothetical protein
MTKLLKPITRQTLAVSPMGRYRNRPVAVTLKPGDLISFRIKGTRVNYEMSLQAAYVLAMIVHGDKYYNEQIEDYKKKKKAGYKRLRIPRRPKFPVSPVYFKALQNI